MDPKAKNAQRQTPLQLGEERIEEKHHRIEHMANESMDRHYREFDKAQEQIRAASTKDVSSLSYEERMQTALGEVAANPASIKVASPFLALLIP